jgi:hypothetical protein
LAERRQAQAILATGIGRTIVENLVGTQVHVAGSSGPRSATALVVSVTDTGIGIARLTCR